MNNLIKFYWGSLKTRIHNVNLANGMNFTTAATIPELIACIYQIVDNIRLLNRTIIDVGPIGIQLRIPESLRSINLIPALKETQLEHFFETDFVSITIYPLGWPETK